MTPPDEPVPNRAPVDLDTIEADLTAIETQLAALDDAPLPGQP